MDPSLLQEFVLETGHSLEQVEQDLLALERNPDPLAVNRTFRLLHSIKGSSAFLELKAIEKLSHQAETLLDLFRQKKRSFTPEMVDVLLLCVDQLRQMLKLPDYGMNLDIAATLQRLAILIQPPATNPLPFHSEPAATTVQELATRLDNGDFSGTMFGDRPVSLGATLLMNSDIVPPVRISDTATIPSLTPPSPPFANSEHSGGLPLNPQQPSRTSFIESFDQISKSDSVSNGAALETASIRWMDQGPRNPPNERATGIEPDVDQKLMRVRVKFLDELLQLTGNMVMARNQLLSKYNFADDPAFVTLSQCVTEVHKTIVQTRMQPIGTLFDRCERLTRDLARQLGKEVEIDVQGRDLELDRSVLEAFSDPLTHLVRNALDHGLEPSEERQLGGKARTGHLKLSARQQGAEIILSLEDDGRGIDAAVIREKAVEKGMITAEQASLLNRRALLALIFESGFSTRNEVTNLSGRGVGLDVVRTNLQSLGGIVEVQSTPGKGSAFILRMPLTQALVSSSLISALVVKCSDERYAIPQTAIDEIIKVDARSERDRIRVLNGRMVYQLREIVLPVVSLRAVLGIDRANEAQTQELILVVIQFRQQLFGLLVDMIVGVDEIVVRPLPRMVKDCRIFSGHTVMGDGQIALILDSGGIVESQQLQFSDDSVASSLLHTERESAEGDQRLVVFSYADTEHFAIPLEMISLIEKLSLKDVRRVGAQEYVQVMQRTLPLLRLDKVMGVGGLPKLDESYVLIPARVSYPIAVLTGRRVTVVDGVDQFESRLSDGQGMLGTFMHEGNLVMLLDLYRLFERHSPDRFRLSPVEQRPAQILLAEDSPFFQNLIRSYLEHPPRRLTVVNDGAEAWDLLQTKPEEFDVVISDIEMPRMDGFELVKRIRCDAMLRTIPVIAVTSLATPEHVERGLRDGFDSYLIKIDKEQLISTLDRHLERGARHRGVASAPRNGG